MKTILKVLLTGIVVIVLSYFLPSVSVASYKVAVLVAIVIALLNMFIRPLLIFLTLPATIFSFGLFLFVINAAIILIVDELIEGFKVSGFFSALLFSVLLSVFRTVLFSVFPKD